MRGPCPSRTDRLWLCAHTSVRRHEARQNSDKGDITDVVRGGPPGFHLLHEDAECALDARLHAHGFTNDDFFYGQWRGDLQPGGSSC